MCQHGPVAEVVSFVGGMNVPARGWGRMNATVPLAELAIDEESLTFRPRLFARLMTGPFQVPLAAIEAAYPVGSRLASTGVGVSTSDGQTAYFWTRRDVDAVLSALAGRGVRVDPQLRRPTANWKLTSVGQGGAVMNPWLRRFTPIGMIAATILLIVFETQLNAPLWWRVWVGFVYVASMVLVIRQWWGSRRTP
jgi:hypothetical protein